MQKAGNRSRGTPGNPGQKIILPAAQGTAQADLAIGIIEMPWQTFFVAADIIGSKFCP
jgi:hypothetical protein